SCVNPSLTTASQDTKRAGELLVTSLLKRINGEPVESAMYPVQLMVRRSCGAR
ncbi:MAG: substrate-binding domain-containing protein, partial [Xanthomonadales bacterium]|nr:substrate-binding domain-containing protein [Xanthomonadales bacterium]